MARKKISTILIFLLSTLCVAQVNSNDSLALVDLYDSTSGDLWRVNTNWLTTEGADTWYGVTVSSGRVTEINLRNDSLRGPIPESFGNLTALTSFKAAGNSITGGIPFSIGNLTELIVIALQNNRMVDTLPHTIGNLQKKMNCQTQCWLFIKIFSTFRFLIFQT